MVLYHAIERDDLGGTQHEFFRIKILSDAGMKYANVSVQPLFRRNFNVENVQGRTLHPDGSVVPFSGQVFEKEVVRTRHFQYTSHVFTMPDVTVGSIIEYQYTLRWSTNFFQTRFAIPWSEWDIQGDLFQRSAHFEFRPSREDLFSYKVQGEHLPPGTSFNQDKSHHLITLDLKDIPPLETEPYMLPRSEVAMRVLFFYNTASFDTVEEYWKQTGRMWREHVENFMDQKRALGGVVERVTSASDAPEVKLRKLYDYVQSFENSTFEDSKSEKEAKKLHLVTNATVEEVLRQKYGSRTDINRTFVALARRAGIDATVIAVTERDEAVLHREWPAFGQLDYEIALAKVNGAAIYLDPGSPFCPFGILPWEDTGVAGLQLDKNVPTWVTLPAPVPADAKVSRSANLTLEEDGTLRGQVVVTYTGEEAFLKRLRVRNEDEVAKRKTMDSTLQSWLPTKASIHLVSVNDWTSSSEPLVATYEVTLPDFASHAGRRWILPASIFAGAYKNPFVATQRSQGVLMHYAYQHSDNVTITIPKTLEVESLPKKDATQNVIARSAAEYSAQDGKLHFTREFEWKSVGVEQKYYPALRQYLQTVQAGASDQVVLRAAN